MTRLDKEQLLKLKSKQQKLLELKAELEKHQLEFNAVHNELITGIDLFSKSIEKNKRDLKEIAQQEYKETMNKQLLGGLGVRVSKLLIYNEQDAFKWAKKHDVCLTLNKKQFEKVAILDDIDFVSKQEKVTITFPKEIII